MFSNARCRLALASFFLALAARAEVAAWTDIGVPEAIAITAAGPEAKSLIARCASGDPKRSSDGGRTWAAFTVMGARPARYAGSLAAGQNFYALVGGSYDGFFGDALPSALYRTRDGGSTWELVIRELRGPAGEVLGNILAGADPDLLYAHRMRVGICTIGCAYFGAEPFVSRDGGKTWSSIAGGLDSTLELTLHPASASSSVVYARTSGSVHRSRDYGATWTRVRTREPNGMLFSFMQLEVDRRDADTLYLRVNARPEHLVSEDGGDTWRLASFAGLPNSGRLVADPSQPGRVYYVDATGEIFESRDRALNWQRIGAKMASYVRTPLRAQPAYDGLGAVGLLDEGKRAFVSTTDGGAKRTVVPSDPFGVGTDLWWNPAESGWGISITQHASGQVFAAWFTYDAQGKPIWRVMPGGAWRDARTFTGDIYETSGPAFLAGPFDSARISVKPVGAASLAFSDDDNAVFAFSMEDGTSGQKAITRQIFAPPNDWTLENFADLWWNAAEPGWGIVVNHQFGKVFATWFVYDNDGRPLWIVMPDATYSYVAIDNFARARYEGPIYTTRGPASGGAFDPSRVTVELVGTASLTFLDRNRGLLAWRAFGREDTRPISRQPF